MFKSLLYFILISTLALGQSRTDKTNRTIVGSVDASGATSTKPMKAGTSLPGTCAVGETYFKTDATAGQNIYFCTATNTWTQQLNSGATGGYRYIIWQATNGSSVLEASTSTTRYVDAACTINLAMIDADQSGSITVTIERAAYTTGSPSWSTISSSFATSSARSLKDTTLAGWTTSVASDSILRANITGTPATSTNATITLRMTCS